MSIRPLCHENILFFVSLITSSQPTPTASFMMSRATLFFWAMSATRSCYAHHCVYAIISRCAKRAARACHDAIMTCRLHYCLCAQRAMPLFFICARRVAARCYPLLSSFSPPRRHYSLRLGFIIGVTISVHRPPLAIILAFVIFFLSGFAWIPPGILIVYYFRLSAIPAHYGCSFATLPSPTFSFFIFPAHAIIQRSITNFVTFGFHYQSAWSVFHHCLLAIDHCYLLVIVILLFSRLLHVPTRHTTIGFNFGYFSISFLHCSLPIIRH